MGLVIEELKQRIVAIAAKVRSYQERADRFRQDRIFQNNQRQFYSELNQEGQKCHDDQARCLRIENIWGTYGLSR